jgi:aminoacylase
MASPSFDPSDAAAVARFREYLTFKTVHPNPTEGYEQAALFLHKYSAQLRLQYTRLELQTGHPIIVLKWAGSDPSLTSIVLNSHMDVVPVEEIKWSKDPWAAELVDGKIYGRGTQDMKSVGIQYMEAIAKLQVSGFVPR